MALPANEDLLRLRLLVRVTLPSDARIVAVGDASEAVRLETFPLLESLPAAEAESRLPSLAEQGREFLVLPGWDDDLEKLERTLDGTYRRIAHEAGTGAIFSLSPSRGDELSQSTGDLPVPPPEMRRLVAGLEDRDLFLSLGALAADSISDAVREAGADLSEFDAILDFGCGCGRVIRHFRDLPSARIHGTDYNGRLIAWCRDNLPFATFGVNPLDASLAHPDESFDLVYGLSVFTHLDEPLQRRWIAELVRVLRPGALLYLTLNGIGQLDLLDADQRRRFDAGELVVLGAELAGGNMCLAFHPRASLDRLFPPALEVIDLIEQGAKDSHQDIALLRRTA